MARCLVSLKGKEAKTKQGVWKEHHHPLYLDAPTETFYSTESGADFVAICAGLCGKTVCVTSSWKTGEGSPFEFLSGDTQVHDLR